MAKMIRYKNQRLFYVFFAITCVMLLGLIVFLLVRLISDPNGKVTVDPEGVFDGANITPGVTITILPSEDDTDEGVAEAVAPTDTPAPTFTPAPIALPIEIQDKMADLYEINHDIIGWLYMPETAYPEIDYPVFQTHDDPNTPENEGEYYIDRNLKKEPEKMGSLFLDEHSESGVGFDENDYYGGTKPSTVMMIYGHNMKYGDMFGYLFYFLNDEYTLDHKYIEYDTLYEHRRYEIISAFRTHVFSIFDEMDYSNMYDSNFKYYKFTDEIDKVFFDYWYQNVMSHSELGIPRVPCEYGDEFLVLSTCSGTDEEGKQTDKGRLCVVAKRID